MRWSVLVLAACGEQWVAADDLEQEFAGPGEFGLRVTTQPEAWPKELYGDAVRATFHGDGTLRSLDEDRELLEVSPKDVNVLDAWDGCPRDAECVVELGFAVDCEAGCEGRVTADAFLSEKGMGGDTDFGGALQLEWIER